MKFEVGIAAFTKTAGNGTVTEEGDIVSILPYPRRVGYKGMLSYLYVIVEIDGLTEKDSHKYTEPLYENGWRDSVDFRNIELADGHDMALYPNNLYALYIPTGQPIARPQRLARFRYRIPFANIAIAMNNIDFAKVRNPNARYQPFKNSKQLTERMDGTGRRRFLREQDVECNIPGTINSREERTIAVPGPNIIFKDKFVP